MMKNKQIYIVKHINRYAADGHDSLICRLLTSYLCSSYAYEKQNIDGTWSRIQPAFKNCVVKQYYVYFDGEFSYNHKSWRIKVVFEDNTETEISLYKFKKYAKRII